MKKFTFLSCVSILIWLCSVTFAFELDPSKFMTVDKIEPGMKGIGKTVFNGTKVDEFQIEVLYVDRNALGPKSDVIWVLCSGGPLEETGMLSGMSGSPVYIDGKLIGAIAYRLGSFPKRPIAGVTPIAAMLPMLDAGYSTLDTRFSRSSIFDAELINPSNLASSIQHPASSIQYPVSSIENTSLMPIQMPVMMSGFHPRTINDIAPILKGIGMVPVQGGGGVSADESGEVPLEPGSVVGVELVRGDMSAFMAGTLTYMDGDKMLALGHPMSGVGCISLPMISGRIGLLVPSLIGSSKYASPAQTIGTLAYDSQYGIMGVLGTQPKFIPMKVRVKSPRYTQVQEYNYEIAKQRFFSPMYIFMTVLNTIYAAEKSMGDYTMQTHSEIKLKDYPAIIKDNVFSGTSPSVVAAALASPLASIMENDFEEADVESVLLEISFEDKRTNATISDVQINTDHIRPGDTLKVTLSLTPYMGDVVIKQFELVVPKDMPEGRAFLRISDAESDEAWEKSRAPMKFRMTGLSDIIQRIKEEEKSSDVIIDLFVPKPGFIIGGQELPALPLTTFSIMNSPKQTGGSGITRGTTFLRQRLSTEYVISGNAMMPLLIDRDAQY